MYDSLDYAHLVSLQDYDMFEIIFIFTHKEC